MVQTNESKVDHEGPTGEPAQPPRRTRRAILYRLEHFTWAWYTFPMSTGGLAMLLSPTNQPHTFPGLETIGKIVYIFDLVVFSAVTLAITIRFLHRPALFKDSLTHPSESLFFATFWLALVSILGCMAIYGFPTCGPWLVDAYRVIFWMYCAITFLVALAHYFLLFSSPALRIQDMTPAWDLPIFPFMLCGTLASIGAPHLTPSQAVPMIVAGVTAQGLGMIVSVLMYSMYMHRMIQWGFPPPNARPAMFIAVGPPSFTSLALIGMANAFPHTTTYFGTDGEAAVNMLRLLATMTAVFMWCLSFFFFCLALLAVLSAVRGMSFHLNWWAFIFPNVGLTIATIRIGNSFDSEGVRWVGSGLTICLVVMYLFVLGMTVRAVLTNQILYAGRDEDTYAVMPASERNAKERDGNHEREKKA